MHFPPPLGAQQLHLPLGVRAGCRSGDAGSMYSVKLISGSGASFSRIVRGPRGMLGSLRLPWWRTQLFGK